MMRRSPKGCCETPSKAWLYAFTSVCNEFFASDGIFVGTAVTPPSSFCQANPKYGLRDFFRGTAVCRSQAFARALRAGSVFVGTTHRYSPSSLCQAQSQMQLARLLPRHGRMPLTGVCNGFFAFDGIFVGTAVTPPSSLFARRSPKCGLPNFFQGAAIYRSQAFARAFRARQRFRRHSAPRSRPFLVPGKTPYRAGLLFSHIAAAWPALAAACFMKAPKSADGSAMRQPYRQKAAFALLQTWNLQKIARWQRFCQMQMAVAANKKTASTLCCEGNSDGHCRPPGSRRNGRFPVHALPALPNRSSFSVTARFMASRARQTPSV